MSITKRLLKKVIYIVFAIVVVYACSPKAITETEVEQEKSVVENIELNVDDIEILGDVQPFNTEIRIDTLDENKYIVNVILYTDFPSSLPKFKVNIKYPQSMIHSLWSSRTWSTESYINIANYARLQSDYNIVTALTNDSKNRLTIATFDDFGSRYTQIDVTQSKDSFLFSFNYFKDIVPDAELLEYKTQILVDLTDRNFSNAIRETSQWRLDQGDNSSITKIDLSMQPVYSVWYPMDRNIPLENITFYFDSISAMGFRSILFDDGWQNVIRFEVDSTGMWDPSKIEIVKEFIDKARESNMKVALWYTHPIIGSHNYVFKKFEGKYLQYRTSSQPILDIRYPDVRKYITEMYSKIISEWTIDGIWFNFFNGYYPDENIITLDDNGRDFVSVRKALDSLRLSMQYEMMSQNPDISINQSFPSVGPLHTSNNKTINGFLGTTVLGQVREKLVNNRLLYGEYSPFMEIMGIHPKDPAVDVAKKFQSVLFGTPYVSYFDYTMPDDVKETMKFWLQYWKSNAQYLMESDFKAFNPIQRYPVLLGGDELKQILVFYDRVEPFNLGYFNFEMADVINSSDYDFVSIKGQPTGRIDFIVYNYNGKYHDKGTLKFKRDIASIEIPQGGYARLIVK